MKHIFLLALLSPLLSMCQHLSLTGKISNEEGRPIPGATISIQHRAADLESRTAAFRQRTLANSLGEFSLSGLRLNDTLLITAVGYEPATEVFDKTLSLHPVLAITLKRRVKALQEVFINTGYQSLPKERVTGSFETVSNSVLNLQVGTDIISRLKGVTTIFFDGNSLRPPLTIRGPSSILGDKQPLIILDNFPYNGDIANINPADVESVTILKDAAAASIWGARAGNGVIVITSKRGALSQPLKITYTTGIDMTGKPELLNAPSLNSAGFIEAETFLFNNGFRFSDTLNTARPSFSPVYEILFKRRAGILSAAEAETQLEALRNLDVRKQLLEYVYRPSFHQQQSLSVSGGSAIVAWYFSAGFDTRKDNLDAPYQRVTLRSENNFHLGKRLRLSTALSYAGSENRSGRPSYEQLLPSLYPYTRLVDAAGNPLSATGPIRQSYIDTAGGGLLLDWNSYPLLDYQHNKTSVTTTAIQATFGLQYMLFKSLALDLKYSYENSEGRTTTTQDGESYYTRDLVNRFTQVNRALGTVRYIVPLGAIVDKAQSSQVAHSVRAQLSWNKRVAAGLLSVLAGAELRQLHTTAATYRVYGYNQEVLTTTPVDYVTAYPDYRTGSPAYIPANNTEGEGTNRFVSLFANGAYTWKSKYTISSSLRRDASNLFGVATNDKWQPLWSAGAAWAVSKEAWYKSAAIPSLRLKLTYGFSGNIDGSRSAVTTIGYGVNAASTNFSSANIRQYPNPSLRWEKIATLNIGAEFSAKDARLSGSLEYYRKRGTDLFGNSPVDYTAVPTKNLVINIADMRGSGLDLSLNSINLPGKLAWSSSLLLTYNTSVVTKYFLSSTRGFDYLSNGTKITAVTGYPVYSVLSFAWAGLDGAGNPLGIVNKAPTANYSTIIGTATQLSDLVYSGPATPKYYGSLGNTFSYKGFTLTANLLYKFGYYFRKESISYDLLFSQHQGNADFNNRWKNPGDEAFTTVPSMIYPNNAARDAFYNASEVLVRKGDNMRLQFLNLAFNWQNKAPTSWISNWRVYVLASDLGIIWRANKEGIDPDYGSAVPPSKTISFGLTATFK